MESYPCSLWRLLRLWAGIGLQSFGGGASTVLLIRRTFVDRRGWIAVDEFAHFWNLSQFTPGINLLALTILIGRKLGGVGGIVMSLAGLLLPSATVTCLLTAGFEVVQHSPILHAVLRGVIPATAGIMGVVAAGFIQPLIHRARTEGGRSLTLSFATVLSTALAIILVKLSVSVVLAGAALLGTVLFTPRRGTPEPAAVSPAEGDGEIL